MRSAYGLKAPHGDDWRDRAACASADPEDFFPISDTGPSIAQAEAAKAICRRCPVVDECLRWALESGQEHGVWGGTTENERRQLGRTSVPAHRLDEGAMADATTNRRGFRALGRDEQIELWRRWKHSAQSFTRHYRIAWSYFAQVRDAAATQRQDAA